MKTPILFFGASSYVIPVIKMLQEDFDLKLVITTEKEPQTAVPEYCTKQDIPYLSVTSTKELLLHMEEFAAYAAPVAALADFGLIIPQSLLDLFPKGIVNIHPSRLPLYRGPTPGQTAILLGDVKTGVSIIRLDKEVDHGPLLAQEEEPISSTDTSTSLYTRLFKKGALLLSSIFPSYLAGELTPQGQDHKKATFTKPLTRASGFLDTTKPVSPQLLDRMIRAYYPWPGVWTRLLLASGMQASASKVEGKIIKFLPNEMLQVEGKKPVNRKDFLNGYPETKEWLQKLHLL